MIDQLQRLLQPLRERIRLLLGRAVVRLIDDTKRLQELQIELMAGEVRSGVERFEDYGFTSHPIKPDTNGQPEAAVAFLAGDRAHGIAIVVADRRYRLKPLAEGEVAIYSDEGDSIVLHRGRRITVTTQTLEVDASSVNIDAADVSIEASSSITLSAPAINLDS